MTEPRDGLVERLAKRWWAECVEKAGFGSPMASEAQARWWLLAIAEELETENGVPCHEVSADWLRTEAEGR